MDEALFPVKYAVDNDVVSCYVDDRTLIGKCNSVCTAALHPEDKSVGEARCHV